MSKHPFYHGDFGYYANLDSGDVEWDEEGDEEPTDAEVEAAAEYWENEGYNLYAEDVACEKADHAYDRMREDEIDW